MVPTSYLGCRSSPLAVMLLGAMLLAPQDTASAGWETRLSNGQPIVVDPATNRAVIQSGVGQGRPLWDGVHRLHDGSTITIRSGVAIPDATRGRQSLPPTPSLGEANTLEEASSKAPTASAIGHQAPPGFTSDSPHEGHCDQLLLKTCGLHRTCADADACQLAGQLRSMQRQSIEPGLGNTGWAESRCFEALQDATGFPACPRESPLREVACNALSHHVCANTKRCQRSDLCRNAISLLEFEQSALERDATDETALIRQRCIEVLVEQAFFRPCR